MAVRKAGRSSCAWTSHWFVVIGTSVVIAIGGPSAAKAGARAESSVDCPSGWPRELSPRAAIGPGAVRAMTSWPAMENADGSANGLAVGGTFTTAEGEWAHRVALIDASGAATALGGGFDGPVNALAVLHTPAGPRLIAGGEFTTADGAPASRIAAWDGVAWSSMGLGFDGEVRALVVHDDGQGPALHAGGAFTLADGQPAARLARWSGSAWSAVGSGVGGTVLALATFDDGGGQALFVGGSFQAAGGVAAKNIARYRSGTWSALGPGVVGAVHALTPCELGGAASLAIGGEFASSGGQPAKRLALWNGSELSVPATGPGGTVHALLAAVVDGEPSLVVGGKFLTVAGAELPRVARWNGSAWNAMGRFDKDEVLALHAHPEPMGVAILASGSFDLSDGRWVERIGRWQDGAWRDLRDASPGFWGDGEVHAMEVLDGEDGPELLIAGGFDLAGGRHVGPLARFHGGRWSNAAPGLVGEVLMMYRSWLEPGVIWLVGSFEDGDGDPQSALGLIRWERDTWTPEAWVRHSTFPWITPSASAVIEHDDGDGPALWIGGLFEEVDGVRSAGVAKRSASGWTSPGGALKPTSWCRGLAFETFDDGGGPALYVGGEFSGAGDADAVNIARWDGDSWSALPLGASGGGDEGGVATGGTVWALRTHDDGSGMALYAGGYGLSPDTGWTGWGVNRYDGSSWSQVGAATFGDVWQLVEWAAPEGKRLVAVGSITMNNPTRRYVLAWDGGQWSGQVFQAGGSYSKVLCASPLADGSLAIGGQFRDFIALQSSQQLLDSVRARNLGILLASDLPWITQICDDVVLREGEPLSLAGNWAQRNGGDLPSAKWLRDGLEVAREDVPTSEGSSVLEIDPVASGDAGQYTLELENACGVVRSAKVTVVVTCAADHDLDGAVDGRDLGALLAAWSGGAPTFDPTLDLDGDGTVGPSDLSTLLGQWGACWK